VYNLEIEGDHTYFVGCVEWGFSVWAHNSYDGKAVNADLEAFGLSKTNGKTAN